MQTFTNSISGQLHLYARPAAVQRAGSVATEFGSLPGLLCDDLANSDFGVSFEQAAEALSQLPRMFLEPDGSFVWRGGSLADGSKDDQWQIDGMLYDRRERLHRVEISAHGAPPAVWLQLLAGLGWPARPIIAQLQSPPCLVAVEDWLSLLQHRSGTC